MVLSVSKKIFKNTEEFVNEAFSQINKENHSLMKYIEFFSLYGIKPTTAAFSFRAGSMLTYEVSRRQAETDFLEEKFKQDH